MSVEGLQNYLSSALPLAPTAGQQFRLLRTVFALVFATALVIHLLAERDNGLVTTLVHAVTIALVYVLAVALASALLYLIHTSSRVVRVWHLWAGSFVSFLIGYYAIPVDEWTGQLLGAVPAGHAEEMSVSQLLPVWFVLTYLFVQPYMNRALRLELARLREINRLLEQHHPATASTDGSTTIRFKVGRTDFSLESDSIRNVVVDDHYCYIYYQRDGQYSKRDLAMPLRDIHALLPDSFLKVHRSHIVNVDYVRSLGRDKRTLRLSLDGDFKVPVSRHRLDSVLPKIREHLGLH